MPPTRKFIASLKLTLPAGLASGDLLGQRRCHCSLGLLGIDQWCSCQRLLPASQRIGHLVLLPRNPTIAHASRNAFGKRRGLAVQLPERRVIDPPVAVHLVDHQLAITRHQERARPSRGQVLFQRPDERQVFRPIVRMVPGRGPFRRARLLGTIRGDLPPTRTHAPARVRLGAAVEIQVIC
jgi:hypothetical protein